MEGVTAWIEQVEKGFLECCYGVEVFGKCQAS